MGLKKILGKVLGVAGGVIAGKKKTQEEVKFDLSTLDPKAQYLKSIARPTIAISFCVVLILGVVVQWVQQLFGTPADSLIIIPKYIVSFSKIIISAYIGSRGLEKILGKVL